MLAKECTGETKCFFLSGVGDFYRYLAESSSGDRRAEAVKNAEEKYKEAMVISVTLPHNDITRVGLAVNYSALLHDYIKNG